MGRAHATRCLTDRAMSRGARASGVGVARAHAVLVKQASGQEGAGPCCGCPGGRGPGRAPPPSACGVLPRQRDTALARERSEPVRLGVRDHHARSV
jgi:hypothetical protein